MHKSKRHSKCAAASHPPTEEPAQEQKCSCGLALRNRAEHVAHVVVSHVADGSTPWITVDWLDSALEKQRSKNTGRFSFDTSSSLTADGTARTETNRRVWYRPPPAVSRKKFDDVFMLVDHLMFNQGLRDFEAIRQAVSDSRVLEDKVDTTPLQKQSFPLMMEPPVLGELPLGIREEFGADVATTYQEMANYAAKCITDRYLCLDEHLNLDLGELLPGEPPGEVSTDHTSSKKKERHGKLLDRELTPMDERKMSVKREETELAGLRLVKDERREAANEQLLVRRRLMKTAGPSPPKNAGQSLNIGDESVPKPFEIDKYLVKRSPQPDMPLMPAMKVEKLNHKKPSYVSRNASPPRSIMKTVTLDKNHPLNRKIDLSKTVKGHNGEPTHPSKPKTEETMHQEARPTQTHNGQTNGTSINSQQSMLAERAVNGQLAKSNGVHSKNASIDKQGQQPTQPAKTSAPKVKQSCEQRTELTEWPTEAEKQPEKTEKPSLFNKTLDNISKYASLNSGFHAHSALRNMSGPPRKAAGNL